MPNEPANKNSADELEPDAALTEAADDTEGVEVETVDADADAATDDADDVEVIEVDADADPGDDDDVAADTDDEVDNADDSDIDTDDESVNDAKKSKLSEKERIARSKEIAARARGKQTPAARRRARAEVAKKSKASAEKAKVDAMTKEQQRYSTPKSKNLDEDQNPVWFKPIMFGFLLLGLVWILTYYLSSAKLPVAELGDWNLLVGIGISLIGFLMMTNWK